MSVQKSWLSPFIRAAGLSRPRKTYASRLEYSERQVARWENEMHRPADFSELAARLSSQTEGYKVTRQALEEAFEKDLQEKLFDYSSKIRVALQRPGCTGLIAEFDSGLVTPEAMATELCVAIRAGGDVTELLSRPVDESIESIDSCEQVEAIRVFLLALTVTMIDPPSSILDPKKVTQLKLEHDVEIGWVLQVMVDGVLGVYDYRLSIDHDEFSVPSIHVDRVFEVFPSIYDENEAWLAFHAFVKELSITFFDVERGGAFPELDFDSTPSHQAFLQHVEKVNYALRNTNEWKEHVLAFSKDRACGVPEELLDKHLSSLRRFEIANTQKKGGPRLDKIDGFFEFWLAQRLKDIEVHSTRLACVKTTEQHKSADKEEGLNDQIEALQKIAELEGMEHLRNVILELQKAESEEEITRIMEKARRVLFTVPGQTVKAARGVAAIADATLKLERVFPGLSTILGG